MNILPQTATEKPLRKTKIICTLGPASQSEEILRDLLLNGMDCARMNFSHGNHEEQKERLDLFRRVRDELELNTPVMLDTRGPEIRTGNFKEKTLLEKGQTFTIRHDDIDGDQTQMSITYKNLHKDVRPSDQLLLDDGLISLRIQSITENGDIVCLVENSGEISSKKSINVPNIPIQLNFLSDKDINDIRFAIENDYDFIALSFVRSADDVISVRRILEQENASHIGIISKIENQQGVDNLDEILRESDGIMVARGDLGVEIPVQRVPIIQKKIIKECLNAHKIVITATQMLDSMIRNPRPTRAEASDVANAIFDGSTCIMLSGETASGKYPVEALCTMNDIALDTESVVHHWRRFLSAKHDNSNITEAISYATCITAMNIKADAIITVTQSGSTARSISGLHPDVPIISATTNERVHRQLQLYWGVYSFMSPLSDSTDALFELAGSIALKSGLVVEGDTAVITCGVPTGVSGTTNMLKVQTLGNILCSGVSVGSGTASAPALLVTNPYQITSEECQDKIIVTTDINDAILAFLRVAKGAILEQNKYPDQAHTASVTLGIPIIVSANGALSSIKENQEIFIDGKHGIVKPV